MSVYPFVHSVFSVSIFIVTHKLKLAVQFLLKSLLVLFHFNLLQEFCPFNVKGAWLIHQLFPQFLSSDILSLQSICTETIEDMHMARIFIFLKSIEKNMLDFVNIKGISYRESVSSLILQLTFISSDLIFAWIQNIQSFTGHTFCDSLIYCLSFLCLRVFLRN